MQGTINYEPNDIIEIREWDEMAEQFGLNPAGDIKCTNTFVAGMRPLCGLEAKLTGISPLYGTVSLQFLNAPSDIRTNWNYSFDMIEPV